MQARQAIAPNFAEQRADEEILLQTHRHSWAFVRLAWLPLLLMLALGLGAVALAPPALLAGFLALAIALPGLVLVYLYVEWRNDSVIVTDQRIIRIQRTILALHRHITQVSLDSAHEINFALPPYDPFARLFRYGTVIVKTAGAQGNLELPLMPRPEQFQKLIIEDRQYFERRQAQRHHKLVQAELQRWRDGDATKAAAEQAPPGPPRPRRGTNGYLSMRIEMSNGDLVYRKHRSVWIQHTALPLLVMAAALTALVFTFTVLSADMRPPAFAAGMLALLVGAVAYYWQDWDWRNDLYIIADDTITLVRKRPFFLQNLRDQILLERIDNVESVSSGLFAALLRYGDVRMSLIGADEPKLFQRVARPREIQQEISRRQHKQAQRRAQYDALQQRQILGEYLDAAEPKARPSPPPVDLADGAARPAQNRDRNRPPGLPRKILAAAPAKNEPSLGDPARLPARLRKSKRESSSKIEAHVP